MIVQLVDRKHRLFIHKLIKPSHDDKCIVYNPVEQLLILTRMLSIFGYVAVSDWCVHMYVQILCYLAIL